MRIIKKTIISLVAFTCLLSPMLQASEGAKKAHKMPTPKADIYIIETASDLPIVLKYPAEIKSYKDVNVVSRVLGVLEKKFFTEGQNVKEGDLLYQIEDDIYKAKVDAAKASVQMSQASLDNAVRKWKRVKKLFASKAVSTETKDNSFSSYEQAMASLALSKAQLHQAQIDLDYTKVKAPINGTTGLKKVDVGDLVSSNPPTKLISITKNDVIYVEFSMPLSDYKNIKNNLWVLPKKNELKVTLQIDNKPTKKMGLVNFMDVNVDKSTSTVKIRASVDNADSYLMPGSFVRVFLNNVVQKNVITIPQKAVLQNPLGTIVFVENQGKVGVRPVIVGKETGNKYVVAGGPLKSGDRVIVNNFFRLKPGGLVDADKVINQQGE